MSAALVAESPLAIESPAVASDAAQARRINATLATTLCLLLLGLVNGAILARLLGVHGRGLLATIVLWPMVVAYFGDLGGPNAYVFLSARLRNAVPSLIANAIPITLVQSAVLVCLGIPLVIYVMSRQHEAVLIALIFMAGYVPLNLITRYLNALNQGMQRFRQFNLVRISVLVLYVVGALVLVLTRTSSVEAAVVVVLLSNVAAAALASRQLWPWRPPHFWVNRSLLKQTFSFGVRSHLGNLTPIDAMQLDLAAVILLLGVRDAGLYAVAISAAMVIRSQGRAMGLVAMPALAGSTDIESRSVFAGSIFRITVLMNVVTAVVILIAANGLIHMIYGSAFVAASPLVRILAIGMVAASLRQVLGDCLRGTGEPMRATLAEVASWFVAVGALAYFVPRLGAEGAALAVSASYVSAAGVLIVLLARSGYSFTGLLRPRGSDLNLIRALFVEAARSVRLAITRWRTLAA